MGKHVKPKRLSDGSVWNSLGANDVPDKTQTQAGIDASIAAPAIKSIYESNSDTNAYTDSEKSKLAGIESGATADQSASEIKTLYESNSDTNAFSDAEKSKLSGIEAGATADQTGAEIKTAYEAEANTNAFTDSEKTKLSNIVTGADVTDTANVDAAGAVMNTDTDTSPMNFVIDEDNMVSDLATKVPTQQSVKAYVDNVTSSAKAYQGGYDASTDSPSLDDGSPVTGISAGDVYDVTVAGTFFTKEVEVGDTLTAKQDDPTLESHWVITQANLTPASIKTQYESNTDTNAYTDAEKTKLSGIESGATADQTGAEIKTAYESEANTNAYTDSEKSKLAGIESGATADQSASEIKTLYESNADTNAYTDASKTKVDAITDTGSGQIITGTERTNLGTAYNHSQVSSGNPHSVTQSDVGLGNVDNTADLDKPISTATQTALDGKADVGHTHDGLGDDKWQFTFSTETVTSSPGVNELRFNNSTLGSVTLIGTDDLALSGDDTVKEFTNLTAGTIILVRKDSSNWAKFYVTPEVVGTTSTQFQVKYIAHAGSFSASDKVTLYAYQGLSPSADARGKFTYKYNQPVVNDPSTGELKFNNSDPSLTTKVSISTTTQYGLSIAEYLETLTVGSWLKIRRSKNDWAFFEISGYPVLVDHTTDYYEFDVAYKSHSGSFSVSDQMSVDISNETSQGAEIIIKTGNMDSALVKVGKTLYYAGYSGINDRTIGLAADVFAGFIPQPIFEELGVLDFDTSGHHSCVIDGNGVPWIAGRNDEGQGAQGSTSSTLEGWKKITGLPAMNRCHCGAYNTFVWNDEVNPGGSSAFRTVGRNSYGELGATVGNLTSFTTPSSTGGILNSDTTFIDEIATTHWATMVRVGNDLYAAGRNDLGQLGKGDTTASTSFLAVNALPGGVNPVKVIGAHRVFIILGNDGKLYFCGQNSSGYTGHSTLSDFNTPTLIDDVNNSNVADFSTGHYNTDVTNTKHIVILKTNGDLYAVGDNGLSQLPGLTAGEYTSWQAISADTFVGSTIVSLHGKSNTKWALDSNGSPWVWGHNFYSGCGIHFMPGNIEDYVGEPLINGFIYEAKKALK